MNISRIILLVYIFTLLSRVSLVSAGSETFITNEIQAYSSSGGNSAEEGEIIEGKGEAAIFLETMLDGEVVEHIEESISSEQGESLEIEKESVYENENVKVESKVNLRVNTATVESVMDSSEEAESEDKQSATPSVIIDETEVKNLTGDDSQRSSIVAFVYNVLNTLLEYGISFFSRFGS